VLGAYFIYGVGRDLATRNKSNILSKIIL